MSATLLSTIWFVLWGLLWAIYFALDGFDLGAGIIAGFLTKPHDEEQLIESLGPVWDGNEVWLITAGGVTFAAFPRLYATMFSSLYGPLFMILMALILRAAAIEFYHQEKNRTWQRTWSLVLSLASLLVALLFGVAFGNIFQGVPLDASGYRGTLLGLLNPYGLLTGGLFVVAFLYNGAAWMARKAPDETLRQRGQHLALRTWPVLLTVAALFLAVTPFATRLLDNYRAYPILFALPLLAVTALVASRVSLGRGQEGRSLLLGSLAVLLTVLTGIGGLFPRMFPSNIDVAYGLTAFNASSSPYTLQIMLITTAIFLPLVLLYQIWFYRMFGKADSRGGNG